MAPVIRYPAGLVAPSTGRRDPVAIVNARPKRGRGRSRAFPPIKVGRLRRGKRQRDSWPMIARRAIIEPSLGP